MKQGRAYQGDHPLHYVIGETLEGHFSSQPDTRVLRTTECGGSENIQFFCSEHLSARSRLCKVDAAIVYQGDVRVVIEIEESNISPIQLGGKVFIASNCTRCKVRSGVFPVGAGLLFIQIISSEKFGPRSGKLDQCLHLLERVPASLTTNARILSYAIHYGTVETFQATSERSVLFNDIAEHLGADVRHSTEARVCGAGFPT